MSRSCFLLLALFILALTSCGPTTHDVTTMLTPGSTNTYYDALALREKIIDAGVQCPGTDQLETPPDEGTTYLDCNNGTMSMAVTSSEEVLQELLHARSSKDLVSLLHGTNWVIISQSEAPLQQLQDTLGGTIALDS